ncbi:MAG: glutamyl-tRNA reductase [bacterium]
MDLVALGLNHRSAPVNLREALYFNSEELASFLGQTRQSGRVAEIVGLSTCNRSEFYFVSEKPEDGRAEIVGRLAQSRKLDPSEFEKHLYTFTADRAVLHLFRVASGIDSLLIGEYQILGQLKDAYEQALAAGSTGGYLNTLMSNALRVGKRVRSETKIGEGNVSVAAAGVKLVRKILSETNQHRVLVVGAGETGELTARHLLDAGVGSLTITSRTLDNAQALAERLGGAAAPFDNLPHLVAKADVVVCATAAMRPIITPEMLEFRRHADQRLLVFLDLSIPRNVDPQIDDLEEVFVYDMDALTTIAESNRERRLQEIKQVEAILEEEVRKFGEWVAQLDATAIIKALRQRFEEIRRKQFERYGQDFLPEDQERLDVYTEKFMNYLLHDLTLNIKNIDRSTKYGLMEFDLMARLLNLEPNRDGESEK